MYYATGNTSYVSFATDPQLAERAKAFYDVVRLRYVHFHLSRYAQPRLSKWYSTRHCKHELLILRNCIVTPISCGVISWFNLALEPRK